MHVNRIWDVNNWPFQVIPKLMLLTSLDLLQVRGLSKRAET